MKKFPKNYPYTPQILWRYSVFNYFGGPICCDCDLGPITIVMNRIIMNMTTAIMIIIVHIIDLYFELNKSLKDNWSNLRPFFELSEVILTIFSG
jgi:hypothetical protein